jgi:hypothetical protein
LVSGTIVSPRGIHDNTNLMFDISFFTSCFSNSSCAKRLSSPIVESLDDSNACFLYKGTVFKT